MEKYKSEFDYRIKIDTLNNGEIIYAPELKEKGINEGENKWREFGGLKQYHSVKQVKERIHKHYEDSKKAWVYKIRETIYVIIKVE